MTAASDDRFHVPADRAVFRDDKLSKVNLFESARMFCDVYCLRPGQIQKPHAHADSDKLYYGLTGSCTVTVGTRSRELTAGVLAVAPAGESHALENTGPGDATVLVVMAPHPQPPA